MTFKTYIFIVLTLGSFFSLIAQSERKMTRNGNTNYESGNFIDAEINYKKALEKNSDLLEAQFNLGDATWQPNPTLYSLRNLKQPTISVFRRKPSDDGALITSGLFPEQFP